MAVSGKIPSKIPGSGSDPDPDYHQNLIDLSLECVQPFRKFLKDLITIFLIILPTDKQTDRGENVTYLAEVIKQSVCHEREIIRTRISQTHTVC